MLEGQTENWECVAAHNLNLAEKQGGGLITLCGGSTAIFSCFREKCLKDIDPGQRINNCKTEKVLRALYPNVQNYGDKAWT